jgi:hypothetical protein
MIFFFKFNTLFDAIGRFRQCSDGGVRGTNGGHEICADPRPRGLMLPLFVRYFRAGPRHAA